MSSAAIVLALLLLLQCSPWVASRSLTVNDFYEDRTRILDEEMHQFLGADEVLNVEETMVNALLMRQKMLELDQAFEKDDLPSSRPFYISKKEIDESWVFSFLRSMPKGGALHTHEFAITSVDWVIANITYREHLYYCFTDHDQTLLFAWNDPTPGFRDCDSWLSVQNLRSSNGSEQVDAMFKRHLSIVTPDPSHDYANLNSVWAKFAKIFSTLITLINYKDIVHDYFYQGLQEFYDDQVQYMEVRAVFGPICATMDKNCNPLSILNTVKVFKGAADHFARDHPNDWCGVRMIYAPMRKVDSQTVSGYLDDALMLSNELPDFIAGFDLVGQEDLGNPLIDFADQILKVQQINPRLKFFFHAGETNWQGSSTDVNILDAVLLHTQRIGHGYALAKHPQVAEMLLERGIAVEVNPISNQVLGLVKDLRNHPIVPLIQKGFPIVISSDDPGLWDAQGLSYDFYSAFMAMTSRMVDLRFLKKLVHNSVKYSSLDRAGPKERCAAIVELGWQAFIDNINVTSLNLIITE